MKLVEQLLIQEHKQDFKTRYLKYRFGRLKHELWLRNRKNLTKVIDQYDATILKNCQLGNTAFFSSAGYYLKDIWPDIDSIEMYSVVKEFFPEIVLVSDRKQLAHLPKKYDNFAVVNNRSDHWVNLDGLTAHLKCYTQALNPGARVFYSFRDTQIQFNRLTVNHCDYFLSWAHSLAQLELELVWHDIQFAVKQKDGLGNYDGLENPDTTNGNLKFWFVYKGNTWNPNI